MHFHVYMHIFIFLRNISQQISEYNIHILFKQKENLLIPVSSITTIPLGQYTTRYHCVVRHHLLEKRDRYPLGVHLSCMEVYMQMGEGARYFSDLYRGSALVNHGLHRLISVSLALSSVMFISHHSTPPKVHPSEI
jgi:hypothetical protein